MRSGYVTQPTAERVGDYHHAHLIERVALADELRNRSWPVDQNALAAEAAQWQAVNAKPTDRSPHGHVAEARVA
jgi:hypothetical protein